MALRESSPDERRQGGELLPVSEYFRGKKKFYNAALESYVVKIFAGDCYITRAPDEVLATILGSCVAACVRDPVVGLGGMNHFLLPGEEGGLQPNTAAARYGVMLWKA